MSLDLDVAQEQRHAASLLAEHVGIVYRALLREVPQELADKLLCSWWEDMLRTNNQPDLAQIMKDMFPKPE